MVQSQAKPSQIVSAATLIDRTSPGLLGLIPSAGPRQWAPAWFYSALNWLGKSYVDASNSTQAFNNYMLGSDVDP